MSQHKSFMVATREKHSTDKHSHSAYQVCFPPLLRHQTPNCLPKQLFETPLRGQKMQTKKMIPATVRPM